MKNKTLLKFVIPLTFSLVFTLLESCSQSPTVKNTAANQSTSKQTHTEPKIREGVTTASTARDFMVMYYVSDESGQKDLSEIYNSNDWDNSPITDVSYLTYVKFDKAGNIKPLNAGQLKNWTGLKNWAHRTGRKIHFVMAGKMESYRSTLENSLFKFTDNTLTLLKDLEADGVIVDIEYPRSNWDRWLNEKYATQLRVRNDDKSMYMMVTAGHYSWVGSAGGNWSRFFINNGITHHVGMLSYGRGYLNSMAFMKYMHTEYTFWKGIARSKMVLGLGFYGETPQDQGYCYKDLVSRLNNPNDLATNIIPNPHGENWVINSSKDIYNKVRYARQQGFGGVMAWHWSCDTHISQANSLTRAVEGALTDLSDRTTRTY